MKIKCLDYKRLFHLMSFSILCLLIFSLGSGTTIAQKKPTSLKLDVDSDDKQICSNSSIKDSQFCDFYEAYHNDGATADKKKAARNEMIELVRGQVDTYYKMRKDGRRTKIKWLQTLFDFLEVGAATAISIMNGERAKTVVGAALNGFQGGRTALNRNFEILQTQALINQMNSDRARIMTEIVGNLDKPASEYSWYAAKNDLRRYLLAGTFNNALDNLVEETGSDAAQAERNLRIVEKRKILREISAEAADRADKAFRIINDLEKALKDNATRENATKALRKIFAELDDDKFKRFFTDNGITATSEGAKILAALKILIGNLADEDDEDSLEKVENKIIEFGKENENDD